MRKTAGAATATAWVLSQQHKRRRRRRRLPTTNAASRRTSPGRCGRTGRGVVAWICVLLLCRVVHRHQSECTSHHHRSVCVCVCISIIRERLMNLLPTNTHTQSTQQNNVGHRRSCTVRTLMMARTYFETAAAGQQQQQTVRTQHTRSHMLSLSSLVVKPSDD